MKKVILLSIILIFLITGIGFAFQNEPDGFRGLKWGDAPTDDMIYLGEITYAENIYHRKGDKLGIGSATLEEIRYKFNFYSYQFYEIFARFTGEINYKILKIIFEGRFGELTHTREEKDSYFQQWIGDKAEIRLYYNFKEYYGWLWIASMKIYRETPEDNKQKEVEKAKEDF
ncbi:hypothetical protein ES695_01900 [Candidatus Atribacteria bacterium 1244-E10-H5-B2]|nr:MAG: hypothetical protein ES695_01900 [Candidatus Atribacteria bacterium 1244-E10-H5-B2]